jgi:hypothetical protein
MLPDYHVLEAFSDHSAANRHVNTLNSHANLSCQSPFGHEHVQDVILPAHTDAGWKSNRKPLVQPSGERLALPHVLCYRHAVALQRQPTKQKRQHAAGAWQVLATRNHYTRRGRAHQAQRNHTTKTRPGSRAKKCALPVGKQLLRRHDVTHMQTKPRGRTCK